MNIIACVKQVPDTEAQIKVKADGSGIEEGQIKWVMNPYDEFGVEEALRLKEKNGGAVTIISVGPARAMETIRTALAMGADKGVHVCDPALDKAFNLERHQAPFLHGLKLFRCQLHGTQGQLVRALVKSAIHVKSRIRKYDLLHLIIGDGYVKLCGLCLNDGRIDHAVVGLLFEIQLLQHLIGEIVTQLPAEYLHEILIFLVVIPVSYRLAVQNGNRLRHLPALGAEHNSDQGLRNT